MNSWKSILEKVQAYQKQIKENEGVDVWFRGQSDARWPLRSTLHRYILESFKALGWPFDEGEAVSLLWNQYKTLYWKPEFKFLAQHLYPGTAQEKGVAHNAM